MIEVRDLSVRFGGVTALDSVDLTFPGGTCGLVGPNGAGKTTLFNVVSGYVTPAQGSIVMDGTNILSMPEHKRARWGVRRTFQTEQAIEELSVFDNVLIVEEHTPSGSRAEREASVDAALEFVGLTHVRDELVRTLPAKERRFIEVARAIVGTPRAVLFDEPAAGLPDEETEELSAIIRSIPERTDATVVLVDHDMALVQACCEWTAVLDFGRLLASGPTGEVLRDERVLAAYLGEEF
jgi:ABC-type branched-subunit amino acid transport system ATPase component